MSTPIPDDSTVDDVPVSIPESPSDTPDEVATPGAVSMFASIMTSTLESDPLQDGDGSFNLATYAERAYLEYAMSVVKGRSLPQGADGQKPVQRRILFAMRSMGLTNTTKPIKSARVVGEVMGKYHPHGDSSIYDAMVLSAQDFSRRYPLVDGQGNFGSRDGDGAAAMRYTEARLTAYADLLLSEMDSGTVDFVPNYDGAFEEPAVLPARLPFILLNGASGAAVGYATEIPSHNLREVAAAACHLIRHPLSTLADLMVHLPAPDFPGGGQIISPTHAIQDAYTTGRGSLRMRARWRREDLARGQWRIVVHELPHGVSTMSVLAEIEAATNPQPPKGKKDLTQGQKNVKALMLSLLDRARDDSDKAQPVRLVLEPKSSKVSGDELMAALLAHTSLEFSVAMNLVVIGRDGNPKQMSLQGILSLWVDFRFVTVEHRTRHRLSEVQRRLHILQGRMKAFLRIDEVIRIIRESDDPKEALMDRIGLSAVQAEDILEIRLRQLARLEGLRIEKESAELGAEEKKLLTLLEDRGAMTRLILQEIEADTKKYGDERRTLVETVDPIRLAEVSVADEPVTIMISKAGYLRSRQGHGIDRSTVAWKQGDGELVMLETRTTHNVVVIDQKGRTYGIKASVIPGGRGDGVPVTSLVEFQSGGKLAHIFSDEPSASYLFTNSGSYGFITQLRELDCRGKAGKEFMKIEDGETVMAPVKVSDMNDWIVACSHGPKESRMVLFPAHEMKVMPKGRGVIVMVIEDKESMVVLSVLKNPLTAVKVRTDGGQTVAIKGDDLKRFQLRRARKGCQLSKRALPVEVSV